MTSELRFDCPAKHCGAPPGAPCTIDPFVHFGRTVRYSWLRKTIAFSVDAALFLVLWGIAIGVLFGKRRAQ